MPTYHCEVFKQDAASAEMYLVFNMTNHEAPTFSLTSLEAGADYHIVVYASNDPGLSAQVSFNTSTLNLAEKRTVETQINFYLIMNDPKKLDVQASMTYIFQLLTYIQL